MKLIRGFLDEFFLSISGDGSGYGDGYGYSYGSGSGFGDGSGYGYGCGYGYGYGYGCGDGCGDGYGYSYGSGFGDGSGSGDGYGYSDGSGDGYGYSYGDGYGSLLAFARQLIPKDWNLTTAFLALWKSTASGGAANGGKMLQIAAPGMIQEIKGPLRLCGSGALHATLQPEKWKGDRVWLVALHGEVLHRDDKCGALKREIICEVK